jgi:hypothetical protein
LIGSHYFRLYYEFSKKERRRKSYEIQSVSGKEGTYKNRASISVKTLVLEPLQDTYVSK